MNENAQKWVQALRSGEYSQTRGGLRRGDSFCCLGVACDLYAKETGRGEWLDVDGEVFASFAVPAGDAHFVVLPGEVRDWLGLSMLSGDYGEDGVLAADNDNGVPFEQIADTVEAEPEGLFR